MSRPVHHGVTFSRSYVTGPDRHYFNVGTALDRLDTLHSDSIRIGKTLEATADVHGELDGVLGAGDVTDIVSYYSVGIVTCLEWHARSRLADLFSYAPTALDSEDLKPLANPNLMSQMIANDVSAPQLVAGMRNVSSRDKYIDVFKRVYKVFDIKVAPEAIIADIHIENYGGYGYPENAIEMLDAIFSYRNMLVHEVGLNVVGPWMHRDPLSPDTAGVWCKFAKQCMLALEEPITERASDDFPNKLDENGYSTGEIQRLDRKIAELEEQISFKVGHTGGWSAEWDAALSASREAMKANDDFHGFALHVRHFPNTSNSYRSVRLGRISYLQTVLEGLEFWG